MFIPVYVYVYKYICMHICIYMHIYIIVKQSSRNSKEESGKSIATEKQRPIPISPKYLEH